MKTYFLLCHVPVTGEQYLLGPFCEKETQEKILDLGDDLGKVIEGVEIEPESLF